MTDPRVAHVIRIQNKSGGPDLADGTPSDQVASDDNIFIDMLRIDKAQLVDPNATSGPPSKTINYVFKWQDGPDDHANTKRKLETIKIVNPDDESQWIKIDIIKQMSITRPNATQGVNQTVNFVFANDDHNTLRVADVTKVYGVDVSSIDMTKGPVDWADYQTALVAGSQDTSQYIDVEIDKRFKMNDPNATQSVTQGKNYVVRNKDVVGAINQKIVSP